jgi:hypothetical protein
VNAVGIAMVATAAFAVVSFFEKFPWLYKEGGENEKKQKTTPMEQQEGGYPEIANT